VVLTRVGANDPKFNLRPDPGLLVRQKAQNRVFASVLEAHGEFNSTAETATGSHSNVQQITVVADTPEATVVDVRLRHGGTYRLAVANQDAAAGAPHQVSVAGQALKWRGPYLFWHLTR
jgi:hypothetical protein